MHFNLIHLLGILIVSCLVIYLNRTFITNPKLAQVINAVTVVVAVLLACVSVGIFSGVPVSVH